MASCNKYTNRSMYDIGPEDLKWSNLPQDNYFYDYKDQVMLEKFYDPEKECKQNLSDGVLPNYKLMKNFVDRIPESYDQDMTQCSLRVHIETNYGKLQNFEDNGLEKALKCLYRSEKDIQSVVPTTNLENCETVLSQQKIETSMDFIDQSLGYYNSSVYSNLPDNHDFQEKPSLHAETISLIRDGITGTFASEDPYFTNDESYNKYEQVVLNNDHMIVSDEDKIPDTMFSLSEQSERKLFNRNNVSSDCTQENLPEFSSYEILMSSKEILGNDKSRQKSNTYLMPSKAEEKRGDINRLCFEDMFAFTPSGQVYKSSKESVTDKKLKVTIDVNLIKAAAVLNHSKQVIQIQNGIFIPESLHFDKEEVFNIWLKEEREKIKTLFENFNIELNIRHLIAERELIKLDRCVKQYVMTNPYYVLEVLELIERTGIELNDILRISQVYESLVKVTKICKEGKLGKKAKVILKKFKSFISPPKGIKVECYINELRIKDKSKLKTTPSSECIIHLLVT